MKLGLLLDGVVLTCLTLFVSGNCLAVTVPASEVPNSCDWITSNCDPSFYFTRTDSFTQTFAGNPDTISGSQHDCNNCGSKNTMNCLANLEADFTSDITSKLDGAIGVDVDGIKAGLSSSIGGTAGIVTKYSSQCGSSSIQACTDTNYTASQSITRGILASCTSTYTCYIHCAGDSTSKDQSQAGGTRTSTAIGNIGSSTGSCISKDIPCDPKTCCQ